MPNGIGLSPNSFSIVAKNVSASFTVSRRLSEPVPKNSSFIVSFGDLLGDFLCIPISYPPAKSSRHGKGDTASGQCSSSIFRRIRLATILVAVLLTQPTYSWLPQFQHRTRGAARAAQ